MKISVGIVGLPNAGKSTLFQALTKKQVNIADYPFSTIDPNIGVVAPKDERLGKIAALSNSRKILPATVEFIDIAGLVKGAHQGQGLGNQFLAEIRETDAIIHLVRVFQNPQVAHLEGEINPKRDLEIIREELWRKDEASEEKVNLLSEKPQLLILNGPPQGSHFLGIDVKNNFGEEHLQQIFSQIKGLLNLITFFTVNENEARSWLIRNGTSVKAAGGEVHGDFETKFIRAEVINWQKLIEAGSWSAARAKGLIRTEGKDYQVKEGDVVVFKI